MAFLTVYKTSGVTVIGNSTITIRTRATALHNERLSLYAGVENYVLSTRGTDVIIARAIKKLEFYKQAPELSAALSARLYTNVLR